MADCGPPRKRETWPKTAPTSHREHRQEMAHPKPIMYCRLLNCSLFAVAGKWDARICFRIAVCVCFLLGAARGVCFWVCFWVGRRPQPNPIACCQIRQVLPSLQQPWKLTGELWKTSFLLGAPLCTSMMVGKRAILIICLFFGGKGAVAPLVGWFPGATKRPPSRKGSPVLSQTDRFFSSRWAKRKYLTRLHRRISVAFDVAWECKNEKENAFGAVHVCLCGRAGGRVYMFLYACFCARATRDVTGCSTTRGSTSSKIARKKKRVLAQSVRLLQLAPVGPEYIVLTLNAGLYTSVAFIFVHLGRLCNSLIWAFGMKEMLVRCGAALKLIRVQ